MTRQFSETITRILPRVSQQQSETPIPFLGVRPFESKPFALDAHVGVK